MVLRNEARRVSPCHKAPHELPSPRRRQSPDELSHEASLDELHRDLAEVERMIRLLEWASTRPRAA